jgi:ArsR family transcriptional regulator, nickel/cobalt-responsive transcriptional repressor
MSHGMKARPEQEVSGTGVVRTPAASLDPESAASVAATLQALATPSRLLILNELPQAPSSVGDLAEAVDMEQSSVSHQLRLLRTLGLVIGKRDGRHVVYSLYDTHVAQLLDEAVYHIEHLLLGGRQPVQPEQLEALADAPESLESV